MSELCLKGEVKDTKSASTRGYSSAGRAPALQAGGHRFEPDYLHHVKTIQWKPLVKAEQSSAKRVCEAEEAQRSE